MDGPAAGQEYALRLGQSFSRDADRRFHALRYDFKPASILHDEAHEGSLRVYGDKPAQQVRLQFQHARGGGREVVCRGKRRDGKDGEVLLIFEPQSQSFVLERVSGMLTNIKPETDPDDRALADREGEQEEEGARPPQPGKPGSAALGRADSSDISDSSDSDSDSSGSEAAAPRRSPSAAAPPPKRPRPAPTAGDSSDLSDSD